MPTREGQTQIESHEPHPTGKTATILEKKTHVWHHRWPLKVKIPLAGLFLCILTTLVSSQVFFHITRNALNDESENLKNHHIDFITKHSYDAFNYHAKLVLQLSQAPSIIALTLSPESSSSPLTEYLSELMARETAIERISILTTHPPSGLALQITRLPSGRIVESTNFQAETDSLLSLETPLVVQAIKASVDSVWHQNQAGNAGGTQKIEDMREYLATPVSSQRKRIGVIHFVLKTHKLFKNIDYRLGKQILNINVTGEALPLSTDNHEGLRSNDSLEAKIGMVVLDNYAFSGDYNTPLQRTNDNPQNEQPQKHQIIFAIDPNTQQATHRLYINSTTIKDPNKLQNYMLLSLLIGLIMSIVLYLICIVGTQHLLGPIIDVLGHLRKDRNLEDLHTLDTDADEARLLTLAITALHERLASADIQNEKLALDLEKAYQQLDIAEKFKSHFLTSMSHEVRTPLNGVLGMLDLVRRNTLSEEQYSQIDLAFTSAQALLRIINDIIDYSDIETHKLSITQINFDLKELLTQIQNDYKPLAKQKQLNFSIQLESQCEHSVSGDPTRVGQIFSQLISNAIKFTAQGQILVSVHLKEEGEIGRRLFCSVLDTGIGITPNQTNTLFEAFTQLDNSLTRAHGGIGLGLTIAKQLCQLMHGNISVESERGKGSRFTFDILLRAAKQRNSAEPLGIYLQRDHKMESPLIRVTNPSPVERSVLIVEDDPISYHMLQDLLREIDIQSDIVVDGQDAIEALQRTEHLQRYEIILMDCELPNLSGYDTTQRIRAGICGQRYKHTPIIAVTSNTLPGDREKCLDAGMNDYLAKPIDHQAFFELIRQWLAIARQQAQIDYLSHQPNENSNITAFPPSQLHFKGSH